MANNNLFTAHLPEAMAIRKLAELYPNTFVADSWEPHVPLQVGVSHELMALGIMSRSQLKAALSAYTARRMYQASLVAGADRIGLDGQPAGAVTEQEAESAAERLKTLDEHRAEVAAQASQAFKPSRVSTGNSGGTVEAAPDNNRSKTGGASAGNSEETVRAPEAPRRLGLADLKAAAQARVRRTA